MSVDGVCHGNLCMQLQLSLYRTYDGERFFLTQLLEVTVRYRTQNKNIALTPTREFWTKNPISGRWTSAISGQKSSKNFKVLILGFELASFWDKKQINIHFQNVFCFFVQNWRSLTFPKLFFFKNTSNWIPSFTLDFLSRNNALRRSQTHLDFGLKMTLPQFLGFRI